MDRLQFDNDYTFGAHELVLQHLVATSRQAMAPYGADECSTRAKEIIRNACGTPEADVFFLTGGTQANAVVIDSMLYQHEGVISVDSGHINVHEAGAIEFTEHKVIALPGKEGKLQACSLRSYLQEFFGDCRNEHCVYPGLVYITFPTEFGTLYSAQELSDIYEVCQQFGILLYIDGARLGYGLMSTGNDITLPYLASHCDAFYIGGTKCGALCGEAVVFPKGNANRYFFSIQKQHGAVIAKGHVNGSQFEALFTDGLYFKICKHGIDMAMRMKEMFRSKGYKFYLDSPSNQQFVVMKNEALERLEKEVAFTRFEKFDDTHTICRFVTSWATTPELIDELGKKMKNEE